MKQQFQILLCAGLGFCLAGFYCHTNFFIPRLNATGTDDGNAFFWKNLTHKRVTADNFVPFLSVEFDGKIDTLHSKFGDFKKILDKQGAVIGVFLDVSPVDNGAEEFKTTIANWQQKYPSLRVLLVDRTKDTEGKKGMWKAFADGNTLPYVDLTSYRDTVARLGDVSATDQELIAPAVRVLQGESELNTPVLPSARSSWTIVISPEASELEKNAAHELQYFHARVFGKTPEITTTSQASNHYYIQPTSNATRGNRIGWRSALNGGVIEGDNAGGVLYAVYEFAETVLNVKMFSATEVEFPEVREEPEGWTISEFSYESPFAERTALYADLVRHHRFAARMRNNGFLYKGAKVWGFTDPYTIEIHSFDRILPEKEWLKTHPEFFSLRDGKRVGGQLTGQLCLTNPEMKQVFIEQVLNTLRQDSAAKRISISQNDNMFFCRCEECQASDAAYGGPGGTLLRFVNDVADAVGREFPKVDVETFAYQYTTRPPVGVTARDNVTVRLCSIGCDFSKPLDSAGNELFQSEIRGWGEIAPRLTIWNYVADFSNQFVPFPNFTNIAGDLRMFRDYGAKSVVEQGAWNNGIAADFAVLRAWVTSRLLWNPELEADKLVADFMSAYYGDLPGGILLEYWQDREQTIQARKPFLQCFATPRAYLSTEDLWRWLRMAERAETAAMSADDPVRLERVRLAVAPIRLAALQRADRLQRQYGIASQLPRMGAAVFSVVERNDPANYSECDSWPSFRGELERLIQAAQEVEYQPEEIAEKDNSTSRIYIPARGLSGKRVKDPVATTGEAIREPGTLYNWSIQLHPDADFAPFTAGRYFARVLARSEGPGENGNAFEFGCYNMKNAKQESKRFPQKVVRSAQYQWYELGEITLTPECYLFVAPIRNADMTDLYVDGIELTPVREPQK